MNTTIESAVRRILRWVGCLVVLAAALPFRAGDARPLPEPGPFLDALKKTALSDQVLLSRYTYDEEVVTHTVDKKGRTKKTHTSFAEVFPSLDPELHYSRIISRDGTPVPAKELEEQDRKHAEEARRHLLRLEETGDKKRRRLEERKRKKEAEDREFFDEAFRVFEFDMQGRQEIDGRPVIVFAIEPRPDARIEVKAARHLLKMRGRMWVSEDDHELVRLELEVMKPLSIAGGVVARVHAGTRFGFQRAKINDEIWLPAESRASGSGRLFLVKRFGFNDVRRYSNYRRYSAETSWTSDSNAVTP